MPGYPNGKELVSKTSVRKDIQVRLLYLALLSERISRFDS